MAEGEQPVPALSEPMRRVVVVGAVGSGKTALGRRLAAALRVPRVDIDALDALPGWRHRAEDEFASRLSVEARRTTWVMSGDFARVAAPIVWSRADTIVWLDLSRALVLGRTARRTVREIRSGEEVYPGCVQTVRSVLATGLLATALRHPGKKRRSHPALLAAEERRGAHVLRFRAPRDVERWVRDVEAAARAADGDTG